PYRSKDISETIDRMYASGRYEDIQVDAENRDNGVAVRFITRGTRFIGHVDVGGKINNPPSSGQMANAAELQPGSAFDPEAAQVGEKKILQLLESNGFYRAEVHSETVDDQAHQSVNIRITVNPGKRARYEQPEISGDTKLPDSAIIRATGW